MAKKKRTFDYGDPADDFKLVKDLLKRRRAPGTPRDAELQEWATKQIVQEEMRRLGRIALAYGIELKQPSAGLALAFMLARDFAPKFRAADRGRGAPSRILNDDLDLAIAIQERVMKGQNVSEACRNIVTKEKAWKGQKPDGLEYRYIRFEKEWASYKQSVMNAIKAMDATKKTNDLSLSDLGKTLAAKNPI